MTRTSLVEALMPWLFALVAGLTVGYASGGIDPVAAVHLSAWIGLFASVLYINWRYWGHPLRFSPEQ